MLSEEYRAILSRVDHTCLTPTATWEDIRRLCDEGLQYATASVCIPPVYVRAASEYLSGRLPVCTVIGFPNGYTASAVKVAEAAQAIADGAEEIDMVIQLGWVKDGRFAELGEEIAAVKAACGDRILKVIVETCYLTEEEKIRLAETVAAGGADYIKTSTGFAGGGATPADVALLAAHRGPLFIKAAGGISSFDDARLLLSLGADRLGTSRLVRLAQTEEKEGKENCYDTVSDTAY